LDEVVWKLQLRNQYLGNWGDGELLPAEKLLVPGLDGDILAMPSIVIDQQQGTEILMVTATTTNPELSALLADTMVNVYLEQAEANEKRETREAGDFIKSKLGEIEGQFDEALKAMAIAQQEEEVIDLDAELKAAVGRVSELISARTTTAAEIIDVHAQIRERSRQNSKENSQNIAPASTSNNDIIRQLRQKRADLELERKAQLFDKTEKHPDILLLDQQIAEIDKQLQSALDVQHSLDPSTQILEVQVSGLEHRLTDLDEEIRSTIQQFGAYPEKMRKITQLKMAAEATEAIYQSMLEQEYEIAIAEAMTVSDMRQVEYAKQPEIPAAPKLLVYVILGGFCGVCFGFGLVFLMEYIDDSIKSQDDLKLVWPLPVLGLVPLYKLKGGRFIDQVPATDPIFESFRAIRNSISFASVDNPINILTVTSSAPGEGKSTFCMNLAICLAQDGLRVVVIDCDLRRPTQHKAFPTLSNDKGVASVLAQQHTLEEVLQDTPVPNLSVMSSGPLPSNPGRLVESLRLRQLILELSKRYDMVIVDAPPVLAVGDAFALARASRGVMMVVEWGKTSRRMLTDVRERFSTAGVEATGVVFNKVDTRTGNYGYYKSYANYYRTEDKKKQKRGGAA
jgi:capsular exopolysaccharide synthesis family protein